MKQESIDFEYVGDAINELMNLQEAFIIERIKWVWHLPVFRHIAARGIVLQYKPPTIEYIGDKITIKQHLRLIGRNEICALIFLKRFKGKL